MILRCYFVLVLVLMLSAFTGAQSFEQTLPAGFENTPGGQQTSFPFDSPSDSISQWHYDSSNFVATGPILINEIYVRSNAPGTSPAQLASYADMEVTLIEASTDASSSSSTFGDNILRGQVVRSGAYSADFSVLPDNGVVANWFPLRLTKSFLYDPTEGNDLIVQLRICGPTVPFGLELDGVINVGVSRRVNIVDCNALTSNLFNSVFAPVVKIDYTPVQVQSLPAGFLGAAPTTPTSLPVNILLDQKWQWHYDSNEFAANGPITISGISIRAAANAPVNAFDFPSFTVTLIEASTDYQAGNHDPMFDANILRSKVVRTGEWRGLATPSGLGGQAPWISLQLTDTFDYDPTTGNDLIIQIESCSPIATWGTALAGVSGPSGTVGGNRYGHTSDCNATSSNLANNEFVPVVRVAYSEREITTFPFRENFDHWGARHGTTRTPPGWIQDSSNSGINWRFNHSFTSLGTIAADLTVGRSGVGFYMTADDSLSSGIERIETPIFDLSGLANPIATFWVFSNSIISSQLLDENALFVDVKRYLGGGGTNLIPSVISQISVLEHATWTKYGVDLSGFAGQRVSLVFRAITDSDNGFTHDFAIDNFEVRSATPSEGGQAPTIRARLNINECYNVNGFHVESGAPGPYYATGRAGGLFNAVITGFAPFQPTALWIGPLNIAVATFGPLGQMDTGTPDTSGDGIPETIFLLGSGLNPAPTFLDTFFFTSAAGVTPLGLALNPSLPLGVLGTFQAAAADGIGGIYLSNAVVFEVVP